MSSLYIPAQFRKKSPADRAGDFAAHIKRYVERHTFGSDREAIAGIFAFLEDFRSYAKTEDERDQFDAQIKVMFEHFFERSEHRAEGKA